MLGSVAATVFALSIALEPDAALQMEADKQAAQEWLIQHPTLQRIMELQNQERARYGLHPLTINPMMASTGWYQHSNLGWPEIIHSGPYSPEGAVTGWIYSPAHHSIMLSGGTQAGFGYSVKNGTPFWVTVIQ